MQSENRRRIEALLREAAPIILRTRGYAVPGRVRRILNRAVKHKFGKNAAKTSTNSS